MDALVGQIQTINIFRDRRRQVRQTRAKIIHNIMYEI